MTAITVLDKNNVPTGPFTRAEVSEKLRIGEMKLEDLAFVEGLSQWTPLREVLAKVDEIEAPAAPDLVPPAYSYVATMPSPGQLQYAGFWLRFAALFLDYLFLLIPLIIVSMMVGGIYGFIFANTNPGARIDFLNDDGTPNVSFMMLEMGIWMFSIFVSWLYFALQESSSAQATLGKRIIGLKVTNLQAERIGFGQASGRFFGKILSNATFMIGYILAAFTEKKQALHDMVAGTLVLRK